MIDDFDRQFLYHRPVLKKQISMVAVLPGRWLKCSNFPGRKKGEKEKEMERRGIKGKTRRERILDRIG